MLELVEARDAVEEPERRGMGDADSDCGMVGGNVEDSEGGIDEVVVGV